MTDLDQVLRDDAAAWQRRLPAGPSADEVLSAAGGGRRNVRPRVAVAASVLVVLLAAALTVANIGRERAHVGTSSSGPCQREFRGQSRHIPPASPTTFDDLQVDLTYGGTRACTISAYMTAELKSASGTLIGRAAHSTFELRTTEHLQVSAGESVRLLMRWAPPCGKASRATTVVLHVAPAVAPRATTVIPVDPSYHPVCDPRAPRPTVGYISVPSFYPTLSAPETALALRIAHLEARHSSPNAGKVSRGWPANVGTVSVLRTTAKEGAQYVGGSTAATGDVLVIRLTGQFNVVTTGPPGHGSATGNQLTVLVPLNTKQPNDFGIDSGHPAQPLPNSITLFAR